MAAADGFGQDRASRMSAAIAYRAVFALVPLLMILVALLGTFLGSRAEAQATIIDGVASIAGDQVAEALNGLITSATETAPAAALIGGLLLLWTASSLFIETQRDLNDVFHVPTEKVSGIVAMVRLRGIAFLWAFGLGALLILTWGLNAGLRFLGDLVPESMAGLHDVFVVLSPVVTLLLLPLVFALVLQTMTAVSVPWRAIWIGGLFTTVVFIAAAYGVGIYLQISGPTALGFTTSLVLVIFLAYFFASVFLFGAEVTKVYASVLRSRAAAPTGGPVYDDPLVVVAQPPAGLPRTALLAFVAGLAVGWRRRRR